LAAPEYEIHLTQMRSHER